MAIADQNARCNRACRRTGYLRPGSIDGCEEYLASVHDPADHSVSPSLTSLLCHWQVASALREGRLPDRRDFTAEILRPWLGNLVIAEPLESGAFLIRLFGTHVVDLVGGDFTGRSTADLPQSLDRTLDRHWTEALTAQEPRIFDDGFVFFRGHPLPVQEVAMPIRVHPDGKEGDRLQLLVGFSAPEDPEAFILSRLRQGMLSATPYAAA